MKKVEIYSDGGARPNPGPGGYGVIIRFGKIEKELSGFEKNTTNNRMELTGAIKGLQILKETCEVELFTDSSYVVNGIEKGWAEKWKANDWMRTKTQKAINFDLWDILLEEVSKHKVKLNWVKGHAGHIENERCDELATEEILKNIGEMQEKESGQTQGLPLHDNCRGEPCVHSKTKNIKITSENQPCKKCGTPVIKAIPKKKNTKNKSYFYRYYLTCPNCKTNYFVDEAKVYL